MLPGHHVKLPRSGDGQVKNVCLDSSAESDKPKTQLVQAIYREGLGRVTYKFLICI